MRKPLLMVWLLSLILLSIGTAVMPNNPIFWLASSSSEIVYLRVFLSILLFIQLVTEPPRNIWFRLFAGSTAASVGLWSLTGLFGFNIQLLDALAFLGSSFAIAITAMEYDTALDGATSTSEPQPARP